MNQPHHAEIENSIEEIRCSMYPDVDKSLVMQVLNIEIEHQDNRQVAMKEVLKVVSQYFISKGANNA